ncbi:hypothetical protein [Candidatus Enterovibrio altilux]|uniref:Uncharacterized protein n=1 Tax=Candidatus Enterovibrio altilux TaxID=1927128 RepID=A0A291B971_9GAMM|nr:hypothetical protein [Candidatus Enterovibrio luxaltus]ATF09533.1 hypothetical protein BTN50_1030 [Candidatus Enterovibrio luxaltus]
MWRQNLNARILVPSRVVEVIIDEQVIGGDGKNVVEVSLIPVLNANSDVQVNVENIDVQPEINMETVELVTQHI